MRDFPGSDTISFRTMVHSDIDAGLGLCRAARWNQLRRDWEQFLARSPDGCRVAVKGDRVVGTSATIRYEDCFSWIGMVLVDPGQRGQGIGTQLLLEALDVLSGQGCVRLDATPAGEKIYHKYDFREEYWLSRMQGEGTARPGTAPLTRPMEETDLEEISILDREVFGADRSFLLTWLHAGAPEYARVIRGSRDLEGYILGRHGFNYEQLGPVVARSQEAAQHLVQSCLGLLEEKRVIIDVPRQSVQWAAWLSSLGFHEQRPFIRMSRGELRHPGSPELQFAILGPEFG
jgi:GNAT superfamily N-acetyltransferase